MSSKLRDLAYQATFELQYSTQESVQYIKFHEPRASEDVIMQVLKQVQMGK